MLSHILILIVLAFFGAFVQTVAGFGISFFTLPALLVFFSPPTAITVSLLVADVICLLVLFGEHRKREFSWPLVLRVVIASFPGLIIGAFIITKIHKETLQIVVGILIVVAILLQEFAFPKPTKSPRLSTGSLISGFFAGFLNSSASLAAPPLVLWLRSCIVTTNQVRDTLAVSFLFMNNVSILVIYLFKPVSFSAQGLMIFAATAPAIIIAHQCGRKFLPNINPHRYRTLLLIMVVIAGVSTIILGIVKL